MKIQSLLIALVLAFLLSSAPPAAARNPGTRITGTIQKVDAQTHEVEMLREDKGTLIKFVWNKLTSFFADAQLTDAAILKKGAHVEVAYHEPLFGKPLVTKVTLLPASKQTNKTK